MRPAQPSAEVSLYHAFGGHRGMLDTGLPGLLFVVAYTVSHDLESALVVALVSGAVLTGFRLARRETLQHAFSGFAGVVIAALVARQTGRAEDFYLPGLYLNAGYALAYAISALVGWPLIGLVLGQISGEGTAWRDSPPRRAAYTKVTWLWAAMFVVKLSVQLPLYLAGSLTALGVARVVLGWPLLVLVIWLSYLILRQVPAAVPTRRDAERSGAVSLDG